MPESAKDYYARIAAATDDDDRLAFRRGVDEWDTFPLSPAGGQSWQVRPIGPLLDADHPRRAEDAADCWCAGADDDLDHGQAHIVWRDEHWLIAASHETALPITLFVESRHHADLPDLADPATTDRAAEMGRLLVVVAAAVEALPSVGRAHVCRWGDGSAHLHWWVMGRPARIPQLLGSFLPLWEEYLPRLPPDVRDENVRFVVDRVVDAYGGMPVHAVPGSRPHDG
jgi:diadenosine tetraphosphate (Ap4A) HIT family hydrolase